MRTTMFGDTVIESTEDDLGLVERLQDAGEENVYAVVRKDMDEVTHNYYFEVMNNDDGEIVVFSEAIFEDKKAARNYLKGFVSEVQFD